MLQNHQAFSFPGRERRLLLQTSEETTRITRVGKAELQRSETRELCKLQDQLEDKNGLCGLPVWFHST